jgi:hypothetical protein
VDNVVREMKLSPNLSAEDAERWRHAVESFLRVKSLYDRVTSNVKISEPVVNHTLAATAQEVKINLVEFPADGSVGATTSPTTAPTTQELESFFQKYANRPPGLRSSSTTQPGLPFGYQRPDRVKIQYLAIRKDQVREAVRKSKDPYDWEVAARRYYMTHQADFPASQPATTKATTPSTTQATAQITQPAASRPTTKPFDEAREQVTERVMEPEIDKLMQQIRDAVEKRLAADWEKQRPQGATTRSATQPVINPSSGYGSFAYLEQIAADIQKQVGVLPAVTSKSDQWLSVQELSQLPGIGTARRRTSGQSFANYVLQSTETFLPVPEKAEASAVLRIGQPSQPVEDIEGNVYLFRVTDAQRAHPPQGLAEVLEQVVSDYRAAQAFERTQDAAKKFVEASKKDGFAKAAAAAGKNVVATGTITRGMYGMPPTTIPNYPTTAPAVRAELANLAYNTLLAQATPDAPHPVALIEMPEEKKIIVAELGEVTSRVPAEAAYLVRNEMAHRMTYSEAQDLAAEWFTEDAIKARLNYRSLEDERGGKSKKDPTRTASAS